MNPRQNVNEPLATFVEPRVPRQRVGRVGGESWVAAAQQILNLVLLFFTNIMLDDKLQYLLPPPFC